MTDSAKPAYPVRQPLIQVILGTNGAGKSTFRRTMLKTHELPIVEPFYDVDAMAYELGDPNDGKNREKAERKFRRALRGHAERGEAFGFESVFAGAPLPQVPPPPPQKPRPKKAGMPSRLQTLWEWKQAGKHEIQGVYVAAPAIDFNFRRVEKRKRAGLHFIPPEKIEANLHKSTRNIRQNFALFDELVFYESEENGHRYIARVRQGGGAPPRVGAVSNPPDWLPELLPPEFRRALLRR